jgi:hypothetical protein
MWVITIHRSRDGAGRAVGCRQIRQVEAGLHPPYASLMRTHGVIGLLAGALTLSVATTVAAPQRAGVSAFVFAQPFWVNLHHFLYVLGRVEAKMPDIQRRAVAGAKADADAGLATLSEAERRTWLDAVGAYAAGLSRKDVVFDAQMSDFTRSLVALGDAATPGAASIDPAAAAVLERAAPLYRKAWWPAHARANDARIAELKALLAQHESRILAFITRAYQESWPSDGYPVNISAYTNWAGAYSTRGRLLVVSSLDPGTGGALGLETIFHEAMHQWDDQIDARLKAASSRQRVAQYPDDLSHAMVFYTAGAAVRSVIPSHVPYAELNGLWRRASLAPLKPVLDAAWKPYLSGQGTLDAVLDGIMRRFARPE